jgi:hypothetical protein
MRLALLLLLLWISICPAWAGGWHTARRAAQTILAITAASDVGASWGMMEKNPLAQGRFGAKQATILGGSTACGLILQWWYLRHGGSEKKATVEDFAVAGAHGWFVAKAIRLRNR